jgi:hydroxyacylglutathione hydrolase
MEIKTIPVGPIQTNCYIISEGDEVILIDPGEEAEKILKELGGLKLNKIILTHLHFDHIIAVSKIKASTGSKVYCCEKDLEILDENLLKKNEIDGFFVGAENFLPLQEIELEIIFTPGHTPGSICLYSPVGANCDSPVLFSGDTIFAGSIGVTHFKGGDFAKIKDSIENKLLTLPDETKVYPGHGRSFILRDEKEAIRNILEK